MAYVCELEVGSSLYIDNQDHQTIVTSILSGPGQQQQSSQIFSTGPWVTSPELFRTPQDVRIKLGTVQGEYYLQIVDNQICQTDGIPTSAHLQPLPLQQVLATPVPPMLPIQPIMGMMHGKNFNSRQGQWGDMQVMLEIRPTAAPTRGAFCPQCGTAVATTDRFCAACGQRL
ncbi:MAG: zinc ribbon domain-containing protein [Acaryochloridaceae cyanobacterium SU_2_1]|nr:zinc ribbon domain-containing protein [Acaryochloridaceae cyanobacterium SU_2_1]